MRADNDENTTDDTDSPATTRASEPSPNAGRPTLDTTGPFTSVSPEGVEFDTERNDWRCTTCGNSYGSSLAKLLQAVDCHGDRTDIDCDRIPTLEVDCSLTRAERDQSPYDDAQLVFMQLLYNVRVDSYDHDYRFDIVWDDMDRLIAYVGLADEQLAELITDGVIVQDTIPPRGELISHLGSALSVDRMAYRPIPLQHVLLFLHR